MGKELDQEPTENVKTVEVSAPEEVKEIPEATNLETTPESDVSEPVEEEAEESEEPVKESTEVDDPQLSEEPTEETDDEIDDSEFSEEPTEDFEDNEVSDEPTFDDEAIVPEEDHYFWHCHRYTGGTCAWFSCDRWRHSHCHHGECVCGWGRCSWHGRCLWRSELDLPEETEVLA